MLRSLQDLVRILTLHPAKYDAIYYPRKTVASDYDKLFETLRKGNHITEEDVATDLYKSSDKKTLTRYFTLKSRLKDRIENGFFFLSTERFSHRNRRRYAAWKEQLIIWVLWNSGAKESAVERLEKLTEEAELLGWNDISIGAYRLLRSYYASKGSMVLVKKFEMFLEQALQRQNAEIHAESLIAELEVYKSRETILHTEYKERCLTAQKAIKQAMEGLPEDSTRYGLETHAAKVAQYLAEAEESPTKALTILETTVHVLAKYPYGMEHEEQGHLAWAALPYALMAKDFSRANSAAQSLLQSIPSEMPEILIVYEYLFLTAMHTQHFAEAAQIFERVMQTPAIKRFEREYAEKWRLFEVYLRFVLSGEMPYRPTLYKPRFSLHKFLQNPFFLDLNQSGVSQSGVNQSNVNNIAITLAQMFFYMEDGDWESANTKGKELLVYHEKYLRKESFTYRVQCFLRMVNYAVTCNFELTETLRKTQKYYHWLYNARKCDVVQAKAHVEPIPFESLWALLLCRIAAKNEKKTRTVRYILEHEADPLRFYNAST